MNLINGKVENKLKAKKKRLLLESSSLVNLNIITNYYAISLQNKKN